MSKECHATLTLSMLEITHTIYGDGASSSDSLKKYAVIGSITCDGQKVPLAPSSAVKP